MDSTSRNRGRPANADTPAKGVISATRDSSMTAASGTSVGAGTSSTNRDSGTSAESGPSANAGIMTDRDPSFMEAERERRPVPGTIPNYAPAPQEPEEAGPSTNVQGPVIAAADDERGHERMPSPPDIPTPVARGSCFCGYIRYELRRVPVLEYVAKTRRSAKLTGTTSRGVARHEISMLHGSEALGLYNSETYHPGYITQHRYCVDCFTHLFWNFWQDPGTVYVTTASIDTTEVLTELSWAELLRNRSDWSIWV